MISRPLAAIALLGLLPGLAHANDDKFRGPDSIVLKNGRTVQGLIIRNAPHSVLMQEEFGENTYDKADIVRIRDESDLEVAFTDVARRGDLPAWRVIANDLRTNDRVKSMVQIPATAVTVGEFRNVPYMSFRVNDLLELDIYGDPNDPAGVEFGIYGHRKGDEKIQRGLRAYLAGFLTTRSEIAALYGMDLKGGTRHAGDLTFEITPPTAPDAYGAWWISLYNVKSLEKARLSDAQYAALTKPEDQVVGRDGRVIANGWTDEDVKRAADLGKLHHASAILLRGFYRDANGNFRLLTGDSTPATRK